MPPFGYDTRCDARSAHSGALPNLVAIYAPAHMHAVHVQAQDQHDADVRRRAAQKERHDHRAGPAREDPGPPPSNPTIVKRLTICQAMSSSTDIYFLDAQEVLGLSAEKVSDWEHGSRELADGESLCLLAQWSTVTYPVFFIAWWQQNGQQDND